MSSPRTEAMNSPRTEFEANKLLRVQIERATWGLRIQRELALRLQELYERRRAGVEPDPDKKLDKRLLTRGLIYLDGANIRVTRAGISFLQMCKDVNLLQDKVFSLARKAATKATKRSR